MKKIIQTDQAPAAIGPYSQAVEKDGMLFISGQIPVNPANGKVVDGGIKEQTRQVMENMGAVLKKAGYGYEHVIKCTCLLTDMGNFAAMNQIYGEYFNQTPPARAAFAVVELPMKVLVEIECVASK